MATPVTNFGKVTVSTGYDASATSIVLTTGHGSRLPSTFPYPLSWWDATTYSDPADDPSREIVIVTNRVGDTLTITRAGEGTSASTKNTGGKTYKMVLGFTKAMYEALFTVASPGQFLNLSLQTHPDNDKALSQVRLVHADSITMDDGVSIASWDNLDANLTASGAGGLDTGSEGASRWYEVYAIYNGTTKNILLHRAKNYFLDEESSAGEDASQGLRSAVDNSTVRVSQGFQIGTAGPIEFVDVKLLKTGTPTGNYWFTIEANSGGVPSNTPLATSDKYDVSRLTTTAGWVRLPFRAPYSASAATQYHLVMYGDYTVSAANFASWRMDGSAGAYANGSKALFDSDTSTWTSDADDDMMFKIYVTENDTSVTMPTGYTQKAKIGYCYNNGSSNLKHFYQKDHTVFNGQDDDWQIGALTATTPPQLVDLFAFLPPIATFVNFLFYNGTAANTRIGGLSATDMLVTQVNEFVETISATNNTAWSETFSPIALSQYQGVMFITGGGTLNLYCASFYW
jgi:hypothetical protein